MYAFICFILNYYILKSPNTVLQYLLWLYPISDGVLIHPNDSRICHIKLTTVIYSIIYPE